MAETSPTPASYNAPAPIPSPVPVSAAGLTPGEAPRVPIRMLFINLVFSMFTALVIFVIASYYFLVPRMAIQGAEVQRLEQKVRTLNEQVAALQAAVPAPAPAPSPSEGK
jgi:hypothetical protein